MIILRVIIQYILSFSLLATNVLSENIQFNLYNTEQISDSNYDYDCIYYYIRNDREKLPDMGTVQIFRTHQVVPYCLRSSDTNKPKYDVIPLVKQYVTFTFEELRSQNIPSYQLYMWSAPIDIAEEYEIYLYKPTFNHESLLFYNCTLPWFGSFCQYSFEFPPSYSFADIVEVIFRAQTQSEKTDILSCYVHFECNRGSGSICLDWREICDGSVDCSNGIDEENCWKIELSECGEREYRCHSGQCIPEEYLLDDTGNPECIDGTDELVTLLPYLECLSDPAMRCEDQMCPLLRHASSFVCGDGQCVQANQNTNLECENKRDILWGKTLLDSTTNLSPICKIAMICMTWIVPPVVLNITCDKHCENRSCRNVIEASCPSLFEFPASPVVFSHVYFVYSNNESEYGFVEYTPPAYVCYDEYLCTEFLLTTKRINGRACRRYNETVIEKHNNIFSSPWPEIILDVKYTFKACLSIHQSAYEQFRNHSSMFHCTNSSKIISKHRLNDGHRDCHANDDEIADACTLKNEYRFKCSKMYDHRPTNICLVPYQIMDGYHDCPNGEDDRIGLLSDFIRPNRSLIDFNNFWSNHKSEQYQFFPRICNGFSQISFELINGQYHSDETECDYWPCNHMYSRCDLYWNCKNGLDELNCKPSKCPYMHHSCVSPITRKLGCLPIEKAGDNVIDCLGGTDELKQCQGQSSTHYIFQCSGTSGIICLHLLLLCNRHNDCRSGDDENFCQNYMTGIYRVCSRPVPDFNRSEEEDVFCLLHRPSPPIKKYFTLNNFINDTVSFESPEEDQFKQKLISIENHTIHTDIFRWTQQCKRGIRVRVMGRNNITSECLCPPAYYGNTCEYQNQRVSLTSQIRTISDWQTMFSIVFLLISDEDHTIESSDQISFISKEDCNKKYQINLLYSTRPKDEEKNYSIRIDVIDRLSKEYRGSWNYPVAFSFLPVNRMAIILVVPAYSMESTCNTLNCGSHGQCLKYLNSGKAFCKCSDGWLGRSCMIDSSAKFTCAPGSLTVGISQNRSICVCPIGKFGSRCYLKHMLCPDNTCKNGGTCIIRDERILSSIPVCICMEGYSGTNCEIQHTRIDISLENLSIPSTILVHFITAYGYTAESRVTTFKKIPVDQTSISVYMSSMFHLIFVEVSDTLYFAHLQYIHTPGEIIKTIIKPSHRCPSIHGLLDDNITKLHELRRIKRYPLICQNNINLLCFYDDSYICYCYDNNKIPNCFVFNHNLTYNCQGYNYCQYQGKCFQNEIMCLTSSMCACTECYYGSRCQFSSKGFGLSLDLILGPHIRPYNYSLVLQISIFIVLFLTILGLINGTLSILTFQTRKSRRNSSGLYLLTSSFTSILITLIFFLKFWLLVLSQKQIITNQLFLSIQCFSMDFLLRIFLSLESWLNACVAIERAVIIRKGVQFNNVKSKRIFKLMIFILILLNICTTIQDPIYRRRVEDKEDKRTWCVVEYSSLMQIINSTFYLFNFLAPLTINFISALYIITRISKQPIKNHDHEKSLKRFRQQLDKHKHLVISPIILILLSSPRLVISFLPGCMKSFREPWLFLIGYFVPFISPFLSFMTFVLPSTTYRKEFLCAYRRLKQRFI